MINNLLSQKKWFWAASALALQMMIVIIFSQMAMEIHAYGFIVGQNIKIKEAKDKAEMAKELKVEKKAVKKKAKGSEASFIMPVSGGITTSEFGDTISRNSKHLGHDWGVCVGTKVKAAKAGTVSMAYYSESYGYNVLINHGDTVETRYAHMSELKVKKGQKVKRGQVIGLSGNTGDSTGPHLHFEVIIKGKKVNPINYVKPGNGG